MFSFQKLSILALSLLALVGCTTTTPSNKVVLFDGKDLSQWREPAQARVPKGKWIVAQSVSLNKTNAHLFEIHPGTGIMLNGADGKVPNLRSIFEHGDCKAHIEFLVSSNSNSGVYLQGRYEVQILDSWGVEHPKDSDNGGIYHRWKNHAGYDGHAPLRNVSKRPGEWQTFDITFRAPRFDASGKKVENGRFVKVLHNGKLIHENAEVTGPTRSPAFEKEGPTGPIILQGDHGPVAFRNLWIEPLDLK
ncbi:MAG: hypothetical protein JWM68_1187 [Verrucomicrobiales bacterium]|nr:hypothetical protein [Verrucomicrobiales bacterium]